MIGRRTEPIQGPKRKEPQLLEVSHQFPTLSSQIVKAAQSVPYSTSTLQNLHKHYSSASKLPASHRHVLQHLSHSDLGGSQILEPE